MTYIKEVNAILGVKGQTDAFARLRISNPQTIFDSKQIDNKQPLFWDDAEVSGAGTSVLYDTNKASTNIETTLNTAGRRVRQTFRHFNYQPGKALEQDELVLTPSGYVKIKDLEIGDEVFDGKGNPTIVIGTADWKNRDSYRITFDDGTHVDCDGEHEWNVIIRQNSKKGQIRTLSTNEMLREYGETPPSFARWRIPAAPILNLPKKEVLIEPYLLGAILGDGHINKTNSHVTFTTADEEILSYFNCEYKKYSKEYGYGLFELGKSITELGLKGKTSIDKFIPKDYLFNDYKTRLLILQGLMDTDGSVDKHDGTAEYNSASKQLAEDVAFLIRSLGGQAKIKKRKASYKNELGDLIECNDSYRVRVILPVCPFRLKRKVFYWKARTRISYDRYVHTIKPIGKKDTRCIEVESEEHTFLTRNSIVTHNSQLVIITGVFGANTAGTTQKLGLFNDKNGLFFDLNGINAGVNVRTYTSGSAVTTRIEQTDWNLDTMDGNGPSGIDIDYTKTQIYFIDFEWLGVGTVRFGFFVDGVPYYCHAQHHANNLNVVYMSTPNLPIRFEIENDGTGLKNNLRHICATVITEGGRNDTGIIRGINRLLNPLITLNDTDTYVAIGLRLKSTNLGSFIRFIDQEILCTSGSTYAWSLLLEPTIIGTALVWDSLDNSSLEYAFGTGATTVTGGTVLATGIAFDPGGGAATKLGTSKNLLSDLVIGSHIDETPQEIYLVIQNLVAGAETYYAAVNFSETN